MRNFVHRLIVCRPTGKIQIGLETFDNDDYLRFTLKSKVDEELRGTDNIVYLRNGETQILKKAFTS